MPPDEQLPPDTRRMLQPQGLFSSPRSPQPRPWPGSGGPASLFAPPPGEAGAHATLPHGLRAVPPGFDQGGPPEAGGRRPRSRLPSGPRTPVIIAAALVLVLAGIVIAALRSGSGSGGTPAGAATAASASATPQAERRAAAELAALLPQSGADRGAVIGADVNVSDCGKNLARDEGIFSRSAGNRRSLLSRLAALPDRSALPRAMISALTGAWQASAKADTDLARWTQDELAQGCHKGKTASDPNLKASYGPDGQATADKRAFTALWNPLAKRYGLKTYQVGDL